jgi:hypothetical protein
LRQRARFRDKPHYRLLNKKRATMEGLRGIYKVFAVAQCPVWLRSRLHEGDAVNERS